MDKVFKIGRRVGDKLCVLSMQKGLNQNCGGGGVGCGCVCVHPRWQLEQWGERWGVHVEPEQRSVEFEQQHWVSLRQVLF